MVAPPFDPGAVKVTVAVVVPVEVAVPIVGAPGAVLLGADSRETMALALTVTVVVPEPDELVAVTV